MSVGPVVSDNSPLVFLWRLNLLSLLRDLYTEVLIPRAVEEEFLKKFSTARRETLDNSPWIVVVDLQDPEKIAEYPLDKGEAAALVLADEKKARLVLLDEAEGRKVAKARGFIITGVLGILLEAKKKRLIDMVEPNIIALEASGKRISKSLRYKVLKEAGEAD